MLQALARFFGFQDTLPGWERAIVVSVASVVLVAPLAVVELYPLSSFPMFSDAPRTRVFSTARDDAGRSIPLSLIGITDIYLANPDPIINIKLQRPIEAAYRFWSADEFSPFIQEALQRKVITGPISFTQELVGMKSNGDFLSVGVIDKRTWSVTASEIHLVEE